MILFEAAGLSCIQDLGRYGLQQQGLKSSVSTMYAPNIQSHRIKAIRFTLHVARK